MCCAGRPRLRAPRILLAGGYRFYGMMGGVIYAKPFAQKEVGLVEDVSAILVKSI